ncbi:MAG: LPS-assembly protein LptD [Gammaproteobacteria bacterium]|nr:LPS-assembly protein LptD [Gammaproteobacteria bacterium]
MHRKNNKKKTDALNILIFEKEKTNIRFLWLLFSRSLYYPSALILTLLFFSPIIFAEDLQFDDEEPQFDNWECKLIHEGYWSCAVPKDGSSVQQIKSETIEGEGLSDSTETQSKNVSSSLDPNKPFPQADFSNMEDSVSGGQAMEYDSTQGRNFSQSAASLPRNPVPAPIRADTGLSSKGLSIAEKSELINYPIETQTSCFVQSIDEYKYNTLNAETNETTIVEANEAISADSNLINFVGNVIINKDIQALSSDTASYNKITRIFNAEGNVIISEPGMLLKGDSAIYETDISKGQINNAMYELPKRPAQGTAKNIQFAPNNITMENTTYSSCSSANQDWYLSASEMALHLSEGYGEAEHAVMRFKGVPIAYIPYMTFPLNNDRKSGFLMPDVGFSEMNGFELATPYYINIAPNQDAIITPQVLSDRGLMLGGEYRYLQENYSGEFYAEWLNDNNYNDTRDAADVVDREGVDNIGTTDPKGKVRPRDISKNRGAFSVQQRANWNNGWSGNLNYNYVSDRYYLDDFASNIRDKSETHLLRLGQVNYTGEVFNFMARTQGYQELEYDTHTYSRLPQLTLSADKDFALGQDFTLETGFDSEFVMFAQNWDDYQDKRVEASRLHIKPSISLPFKNSYSFIKPKLSLDMVTYQLDNEDSDPERSTNWDDDSPSRVAPIFSLDSGLFLERDLSLFDTPMLHTLEPRLYYLYTPEKDQDDIPLFDTGLTNFSFNQLFRESRFTGADRLGDASQLSAAFTTRFIDENTGAERFTASIGQIYYFEDRNVTLDYNYDGDPIHRRNGEDTRSSSSVAAEITSQFAPSWYTSYSLLYNPNDSGVTDEARYRLQYKSDRYHIANLDYSYRAQDYEQIELSSYWKIASNWSALAHWYYSLYDHRASDDLSAITIDKSRDSYTLDSKLGLEYDSCCYALRFIVGREQDNYYAKANNYVMLQIQFKGLGSLSQALAGSGHDLEEDIPGFEAWKN